MSHEKGSAERGTWPVSLCGTGNPQEARGQALLSKGTRPRSAPHGPRTGPALTSCHRLRRCMVFPQNVDVSESASYLPAKQEKKSIPIMKGFLKSYTHSNGKLTDLARFPSNFQRKTGCTRLGRSHVQDEGLPGSRGGVPA